MPRLKLKVFLMSERVEDKVFEDDGFFKCVWHSLCEHRKCNWGDVSPERWQMNDEAFKDGKQIMSAYSFVDIGLGRKIWIITEADRSKTTILFPEEY